MTGFRNSLKNLDTRTRDKSITTLLQRPCEDVTFAGHVVLAGCGEASAAMAVDGCYPELVPALRSKLRQNRILGKGLKINKWQ